MGLYGRDHIIFLISFAIIFIAVILILKFYLKTEKQKEILIRFLGGILTFWIVSNRISLAIWKNNILELIPNTYCGMTSLILGISALFVKPHNKVFDFLIYLELIGGIATIFYSSFLLQGPSFWFYPTLSGMVHHAVGVLLCVVLIICKWFEPSFSRWYVYTIGLSSYTLFGLFLLDVLHIPETMQIDSPIISGTPLKWWFFLIFGTIAIICFTYSYDKIKTHKSNYNKNK